MFLLGQISINSLFAMISAYLNYIFLKENFCIKIKTKYLFLFTVITGIFNGTLSTIWTCVLNIPDNLQFLRPLLLFILNITIIKYFFKVEWIKAVLSFSIIIVFTGIAGFIVPLLFYPFGIHLTYDVINYDLFLYFLVNIIIYTLNLAFIKLIHYARIIRNIKNLTPIGFLLVIIIITFASFAGVSYIVEYNLATITVFLISSLMYFILSAWYINLHHKYEIQKEEQQQQKFYNESLANTLQDLKRIKHDNMNHLSVLYAMLQMKKYDAAQSYLKEIINTNESMGNMAIYDIKNAGLFGIISTKLNYANSQGIKFELKVFNEIDSIPNIKISDLCEVIGIYLDNAIEEVSNNCNLKLEMQISSDDQNIIIRIDNECTQIPDLKNSQKGTDRGNGLAIANKILSTYKNIKKTTSFDNDSMVFSQVLTIKKDKVKKEALKKEA